MLPEMQNLNFVLKGMNKKLLYERRDYGAVASY